MNDFEPILHAGGTARIRFTGEDGVFRNLVIRGALLELVTFGFYRFWLATDIRRYLWSNTEIAGDAVEYTGRGKELLLGFLVALAVLLPVFLVYFLTGIAFERIKAFASVPLYGFFFLFGQFAVYRARRYRLTRTIWRGIRFWMTGSGWSYAWRSLLWGLLLVPTLGFAYPWRMAALERYKLGHTYYGDLPGRFAATGGQLFRRVWPIWFLGMMPVVIVAMGTVAAVLARGQGTSRGGLSLAGAGFTILAGVFLCVGLPFLHAIRKATEWRWWVEGIRFGDVAVACVLPRNALIGFYWKLIGLGLLAVIGFAVIAMVVVKVFLLGAGEAGSLAAVMARIPIAAIVAYAIWYLALVLTFGVLGRIYTLQRVWRQVIGACTLLNPEAAADVMAAGEAASALGEGLADGLDFAGF